MKVALTMAVAACTGPSYVVDAVEDELAAVADFDGGLRVVKRIELPEGAREGDVVVDGRVDARRRAELERRIREARRRLTVRGPR